MKLKKYLGNPILSANPDSNWDNFCVLNPAVVYDERQQKFIMLYRAAGDDVEHVMRLGLATSDDGIHFERASKDPVFAADPNGEDGAGPEDPRLVKMGDVYYLTYAAKPYFVGRYWLDEPDRYTKDFPKEPAPEMAPTFLEKRHTVTYLAYTRDFRTFKKCGRITDSRYDDRDCVLFPEKVNGKFVKIERPYCDGPNPSIWISYGDDLMEWEKPELLYRVGQEDWESERVGAGCPPLKTDQGWLFLYHGVSKKDHLYRVGLMLLDLLNPSKILAKTKHYVMEPELPFEFSEMYPGCVFPTGWVEKDGTLYIYYGCGDRYVSLATTTIKEILEELSKKENRIIGR